MSKGYKVTYDENTIEFERIKEKKPSKAFGIISMALGLFSLLANFIALPALPLSFIYPYVSIFLSYLDGKKNNGRTVFGKIGLISSIVSIILSIIGLIISIILIILVIAYYAFIFYVMSGNSFSIFGN